MLVTALLLGLGLIGATWSSWRDAEGLRSTLDNGQAELLLASMREISPPRLGFPSKEGLRQLFAVNEANGLRGAGFVEPDGALTAIVGSFATSSIGPGDTPMRRSVRRVNGRVRIMAPAPRHLMGPHPGPPPPPPPPSPEDSAPTLETRATSTTPSPPAYPPPPPPEGPPRHPHPPWPPDPNGWPSPPRPVALEFEPTFAASLIGRSQRNFALGLGSATLLAVVAVVLWRRAQREEAMAERRAQNDRLAALGSMSAVLAHEIKNPLAALKGNAQLVAEALPDGSRGRAQADRVVEASIRLQELVTNLLDFVRGGPIARAPVDPAELLFLAAEDAAPDAELELDAAPASWSLDSVRIRQVLENLLRNAAQAAEGRRVWASVAQEGGALIYSVRDEGPGLPAGGKEAIFEPFFTTKTRGVGLGLTVARRIAELHGGELTARSRPEGGAEFRVIIPFE